MSAYINYRLSVDALDFVKEGQLFMSDEEEASWYDKSHKDFISSKLGISLDFNVVEKPEDKIEIRVEKPKTQAILTRVRKEDFVQGYCGDDMGYILYDRYENPVSDFCETADECVQQYMSI